MHVVRLWGVHSCRTQRCISLVSWPEIEGVTPIIPIQFNDSSHNESPNTMCKRPFQSKYLTYNSRSFQIFGFLGVFEIHLPQGFSPPGWQSSDSNEPPFFDSPPSGRHSLISPYTLKLRVSDELSSYHKLYFDWEKKDSQLLRMYRIFTYTYPEMYDTSIGR